MNPMKIDNGPPHVHAPHFVEWDSDAGSVYGACAWCGERVDDFEIDDVYTNAQAEAQCGVSWLVDLRLGAVVFAGVFGLILLALWVFGR